jgi:hypothetical protein
VTDRDSIDTVCFAKPRFVQTALAIKVDRSSTGAYRWSNFVRPAVQELVLSFSLKNKPNAWSCKSLISERHKVFSMQIELGKNSLAASEFVGVRRFVADGG